MFTTIFITVLVLFGLAVFLNIGFITRPFLACKPRFKLIALFWIILLAGMTLWSRHTDMAGNFGFMSLTYAPQILSVLVVAIFTLARFSQSRFPAGVWKAGVGFMLMYGVFGMFTSIVSPVPLFTLWKGGLIVLDALLVMVAIASIDYKDRVLLFNITIAYTQILLMLVLAGGVLWPEESMVQIRGLIGLHLYGVVPHLNPNEIGFLSAINALVAIRRLPEVEGFARKYLYAAILVSALVVLIMSQARTSVIGFVLGLMFLGLGLRKLRVYAILGALVLAGGISHSLITGSSLGVGEVVTTYMERGVSKEQLESMSGRTGLWEIGYDMFKTSPLIGLGFEAGVRFNSAAGHMHNAHMQALVNTGILGYLLWLLFVGAFGVGLLTVRKRLGLHNDTEDGRMHYEIMAIFGVMILRTVTGSVLIFQSFSLMLLMSMQVFLFAVQRRDKVPDGTGSPEKADGVMRSGKYRLMRKGEGMASG